MSEATFISAAKSGKRTVVKFKVGSRSFSYSYDVLMDCLKSGSGLLCDMGADIAISNLEIAKLLNEANN